MEAIEAELYISSCPEYVPSCKLGSLYLDSPRADVLVVYHYMWLLTPLHSQWCEFAPGEENRTSRFRADNDLTVNKARGTKALTVTHKHR